MSPDANHGEKHTFNAIVELTQVDNSSGSATMVDVDAGVVYQGRQIAKCQGNLIKREMMTNPEMFPYLMEVTQELEEVAKDYDIFHPALNGTMTSKIMEEYFEKLGFFHEDDYKAYRQTNEVEKHPCNRAWILYFNTFTVDEGFRRRHIGMTLVRGTLETAMRDATAAGRPLLAGVRPGFLDTSAGGEAVSVRFWRSMGFERYSFDSQTDLFFWGVTKGLPDEETFKAFSTG